MIFNSSQDLLYIVLALATAWVTVFLCWLLYQAARALQNINRIMERVTGTIEMIAEAMEFIRRRLDSMSGSLGVVSTFITNLAEKFIAKKLAKSLDDSDDDGEKKVKPRKKKK